MRRLRFLRENTMGTASQHMKQQIAMTALNEMMSKSYFSICAVRDAAELLGVNPRRSEAYQLLSPLHTIDWRAMSPEVRAMVPQLIMEVLQDKAGQFQFVDPSSPADAAPPALALSGLDLRPKESLMRRLFARMTS